MAPRKVEAAIAQPVTEQTMSAAYAAREAAYRAQIADLAERIGRPHREIMVEHELVVLLGPAEM